MRVAWPDRHHISDPAPGEGKGYIRKKRDCCLAQMWQPKRSLRPASVKRVPPKQREGCSCAATSATSNFISTELNPSARYELDAPTRPSESQQRLRTAERAPWATCTEMLPGVRCNMTKRADVGLCETAANDARSVGHNYVKRCR